jgi:hypothetical protein
MALAQVHVYLHNSCCDRGFVDGSRKSTIGLSHWDSALFPYSCEHQALGRLLELT